MSRTLERLDVPSDEEVGDVTADPIAPAGPTSPAVRLSAAAILAVGIAAGAALSRRRAGNRVVAVVAGSTISWTLALTAAAIRSSRVDGTGSPTGHDPAATRTLPFVSVLVAARDEAAALPRLLDDLDRQDHVGDSGPRYEVLVVDDRSTDATAQLVRDAAGRAKDRRSAAVRLVSRRGSDIADGKGAALRSVPAWLPRGEVLAVLDADARVDSGFVRRAATLVDQGHRAVTARRRVLGASRSRLAQAQDDEQTADLLLQLGRRALDGSAELRGNGVVVTRDALQRSGGWPADALTEDLELSTRLALAGVGIVPSVELVVREAPVAGLAALWTQRVRWAEGSARRYLGLGPSIVRTPGLAIRRRLDLLAYGAQLALPGVVLGATAAGFLPIRGRRRSAVPALLVGSYALTAVAVAGVAIAELEPDGRPPVRSIAVRAVRTAVFSGLWLLVLPVALLRIALVGGELRYRKTTHRRVDC